MILNLNKSPAPRTLHCDICIIGAGAAGITLARELANTKLSVCLLESGGFEYDEDTQLLYEGTSTGISYDPLLTRLRYFGGTTNHWGGTCRPLDEIDFKKRSWVPHSGWPITHSDLTRYVDRAQEVCQLKKKAFVYRPSEHGPSLPFLDQKNLVPLIFRSNALNFGEAYHAQITRAPNITTVLNANVQSIETNEAGNRVTHIQAKSLSGHSLTVRANKTVLACGGIENPRLLLLSRKNRPQGLGNQHDNVGRYFQEHIYFHLVGLVVLNDPSKLANSRFADKWTFDFGIGEPTQKTKHLLNCYFQASPTNLPELTKGVKSAKEILDDLSNYEYPDNLLGHVRNIAADFDNVSDSLYRHYLRRELHPFNMNHWAEKGIRPIDIKYSTEQVPNPSSRITLGSEKDALGLPKVNIDWRFTDLDKQSMQQALLYLGAEIGRLSAGRFWIRPRVNFQDEKAWPFPHGVGCHHIGTTRMHDDPRQGVVDRNCAVHGVPNLFVAGSSVFTTSGHSNPTLTIVALSLRLADHLKATTRKS